MAWILPCILLTLTGHAVATTDQQSISEFVDIRIPINLLPEVERGEQTGQYVPQDIAGLVDLKIPHLDLSSHVVDAATPVVEETLSTKDLDQDGEVVKASPQAIIHLVDLKTPNSLYYYEIPSIDVPEPAVETTTTTSLQPSLATISRPWPSLATISPFEPPFKATTTPVAIVHLVDLKIPNIDVPVDVPVETTTTTLLPPFLETSLLPTTTSTTLLPITTTTELEDDCTFRCSDGTTCLQPEQLCDDLSDCPQHETGQGGEDEDQCGGSGDQEVVPTTTTEVPTNTVSRTTTTEVPSTTTTEVPTILTTMITTTTSTVAPTTTTDFPSTTTTTEVPTTTTELPTTTTTVVPTSTTGKVPYYPTTEASTISAATTTTTTVRTGLGRRPTPPPSQAPRGPDPPSLAPDSELCASVVKQPQRYLVPHPTDCTLFLSCQHLGKNRFKAHVFTCPLTTSFQSSLMICNFTSSVCRAQRRAVKAMERGKSRKGRGRAVRKSKKEKKSAKKKRHSQVLAGARSWLAGARSWLESKQRN